MAITISGENNNDKILATDGVIDQISGFNIVGLLTAGHINVGSNIQLGNAGVITATTFDGNLTGNVNNTSPLLLQTGGSERFRITGNNELGIAGANYGTSGQVLTSGGSGSAVSWTTIPTQVSISGNADNRIITGGSGTNLTAESKLTFDGTGLLHLNNSTGSSDAKLKIESESGYDARLILDTSNGSGAGAHIDFQIDGTLKGGIQYVSNASASDTHDIIFRNNTNDERLRIDSSGLVSIGGNSTVNTKLHVENSSGDAHIRLRGSVNYGVLFTRHSDGALAGFVGSGGAVNLGGSNLGVSASLSGGDIVFQTGGTASSNERARINHVGKVGIGTTGSDYALSIREADNNNKFLMLQKNSGQELLQIREDGSNHIIFDGSHASGELLFYTAGNERLRIGSAGKLTHIQTDGGEAVNFGTSSASGAYHKYDMSASGATTGYIGAGSQIVTGAAVADFGLRSQANMVFSAGGATEALRIRSDGKVTLGTTTPSSNGAAYMLTVADPTNSLGNCGITIRAGTGGGSNTNQGSIFYSNATSGTGEYAGYLQYNHNDNWFRIGTNSHERLRIDSSGRSLFSGTLGYGNIPFGGNPSNAAIQIRCNSKYNGIAFGENAVSGAIGLGGADTTTAMVFTANAHPANLGGGVKDIFEWWSGNSGGGGPTKYMTLDTGGHLGLMSGNLEFANGAGIDFSAVPDGGRSISTDGNKLDDYEEGVYVPTTNNGLSLNSSYNTFAYIKVGRMVTIRGLFYPANNPSGNYAMYFSLPFQAYNYGQIAGAGGSGVMYRHVSNANAGVAVYVEDGGTIGRFYRNGEGNAGWSPVYNTDWNSAMEVYVDFTYFSV